METEEHNNDYPDVCPAPLEELPDLNEVVDPDKAVPALLATTVQQTTQVKEHCGTVYSVPENTQIVVPVLPESIPLIAKVPDVKSTVENEGPITTEVVKISQVLPGYAPSYASDYMPSEVNEHTFTTFANTVSFNVSRYPTLSAVTDSKSYNDRKKAEKDEQAVKRAKLEEGVKNTTISTQHEMKGTVEYVPAEYLKVQHSSGIPTVSASVSVSVVKPDVLSSGRVLTNMTPFPCTTTTTMSNIPPTSVEIDKKAVDEPGNSSEKETKKQDGPPKEKKKDDGSK